MWDSEEFSCRDCHMAFRSGGLLDKHKARFCLGSDIGDPAVLRQGRVEFAKPERSTWRGLGPWRTRTPDLISLRAERVRQSKAGDEGGDPQASTTESVALRRLTNEFLKLRMSIQESMSSLPQQPISESVAAVPEVCQVGRGERLREMAEQHGHQLAEIRAHTGHLEQQKQEIEQRLAAFAGLSGTAHLESLLQELREQEERNEEALQHLRTQISLLQPQQQGAKDADAPPHSPEDRRTQHVTFDLISSVDGPLSNQIRSLRLAYMQSGGSDPEILAQMHDLQAEAHTLEQSQRREDHKTSKRRVKLRPQAVGSELTSLESDNRQLEEEIFRIQLLRQRHRGEEVAGAEFQLMQRQQLAGLQGEIESLRREVARTRANRQGPPPPPPPLFPGGPGAQLHPLASLEQRKAQTPLLTRRLLNPHDTLGPAPYDPAGGFVIFYDMVVGVNATLTALRLVVGLFCLGQELGRPTPLPPVQCQPAGSLPYPYSMPTGNYAILSAKQPVPRIQPSQSLSLLVEVQAAGGVEPYGQDLVSRGWTRLQLFDQHNQVLSGYWRVPIRILPVRPSLSPGQLNSVSQLGSMELCLRVTNARDGEVQSLAKIDPSDTSHYKYPALASGAYGGSAPLHLTALQPSSNSALSAPSSVDQVDPPTGEESSQSDLESVAEKERKMEGFGVIIDRVKGAAAGQGSVRLTGYSLTSGQVIMCGLSAVHCSTSTVSSCITHGHFIFGEQQACFPAVQPREDLILILRFYHLPPDGAVPCRGLLRQREVAPWETGVLAGDLTRHEECVVAWGAIRLTRATSQRSRGDERGSLWNTGTHLVPLYCTPVPPVVSLSPLPDECLVKPFKPYSVAEIRLHIYSGQATPFPLPPESPVPSADQTPPTLACEAGFSERVRPPMQPFCQGNVVILHIDGARFLPDCSTISRVMGGVFDHHYNQVGPDIATGIDLDSNIFEPVYNFQLELRCPTLPTSSTVLLKVYTVDKFSLKTVTIGWAALGLFLKSGSETQATIDTNPQQVCLNEGAHQLRLHHQCPGTPLSSQALASSSRVVPCATVLVRVSSAPTDGVGPTEAQSQQPQQLSPTLSPSDRVYYSGSALPTPGETRLLTAMMHRSFVSVRETALFIAGDSWGPDSESELEIGDWIMQKLSHVDYTWPQPFNLNLVSPYSCSDGFKVCVESALNLPWCAFPMGTCTLCPPAAAYQGPPWLAHDHPNFIQCLVLNSSYSAPQWSDGYMSFHQRVYHKYMTAIIHLYAVSVIPIEASEHMHDSNNSQKMEFCLELGQQCWAAVPIFTHGYCNTARYQLPLFSGAPSQKVLSALRNGKCKHVLKGLLQNNEVQLLSGASVFVRVADGRRHQELEQPAAKDAQRSFLRFLKAEDTQKPISTLPLHQLIPERLRSQSWVLSRQLGSQFKQVVHQELGYHSLNREALKPMGPVTVMDFSSEYV